MHKNKHIPWQGNPEIMSEVANVLAQANDVQCQYIDTQCFLFLASEGWEKKDAEDRVYHYCRQKYFAIIETYGCDRENVFQQTMMLLYNTGIADYCNKRSTVFEGFFLVSAKNAAYKLKNESYGIHNAFYYGKIKGISDKYDIQICVGNAYKFFQILKLECSGSTYSLPKIITAIAKYGVETATPDGDIDRLAMEMGGEICNEDYQCCYG